MAYPGPVMVDLSNHVSEDRIVFFPAGVDKQQALRQLAEVIARHPAVTDEQAFIRAIFEREAVSSTGIGGGIAVPHAKLPSIDDFLLAIGVSASGIDFEAKDDRPVHVLVMIAASDQQREAYLRVLATVAAHLKNPDVYRTIRESGDPVAVVGAMTHGAPRA